MYSIDYWRAAVISAHSFRTASARFRTVVLLIPLTGIGAFWPSSCCSSVGHVYDRAAGSTPPATTFPLRAGAGNMSGMFTASWVFPASVKSSEIVRALIDLNVTGKRFVTPGLCSRMSKTPWPAGLRPVMNVGHAHHECEGTLDRQSPYAPRSIRLARLGSSPASSI